MATSTLPLTFCYPNWYTSTFISNRLRISLRTIQHWCKTGFFQRRGCTVILAPNAWRVWTNQYWIHVPPQIQSKDAILRKLNLDTIPLAIAPSASEGTIPISGATPLC